LLLVYRRYYGTRLTVRMLVVFWCVMSAAGFVTEVIFRAVGLVPTVRASLVTPPHFSWDYTAYLNTFFLALFAFAYWVYRARAVLGGNGSYVLDVVCGMQVEMANAPASTVRAGKRLYFCSDRCRTRFEADPGRFAPGRVAPESAVVPLAVPVALGRRVKKEEGQHG
jgi:YHS domain-containing protein